MKLVNVTPHPIKLIRGDKTFTFESEGIARVETTQTVATTINDVPFYKTVYGEVTGIPEPEEGVYYIVSAMVLNASERTDLVAPNTAKAIRDESGRIVGVDSFIVK